MASLLATKGWEIPIEDMELLETEVHVWKVDLELATAVVGKLASTLDGERLQKAARFYQTQDRIRFIAAHGALRSILADYLHLEPHQLAYQFNPAGKPGLVSAKGEIPLQFNISHSRNLALVAVSLNRQVGVDIEYTHGKIDSMLIARRFFSPGEAAGLASLPLGIRREAFYNCWTRKEAYIKARGAHLPLNSFSVSFLLGEAATLTSAPNDEEVSRWSLCALDPGPGYAAALAVEGFDWNCRLWQWVFK